MPCQNCTWITVSAWLTCHIFSISNLSSFFSLCYGFIKSSNSTINPWVQIEKNIVKLGCLDTLWCFEEFISLDIHRGLGIQTARIPRPQCILAVKCWHSSPRVLWLKSKKQRKLTKDLCWITRVDCIIWRLWHFKSTNIILDHFVYSSDSEVDPLQSLQVTFSFNFQHSICQVEVQ